MGGAGQSLATHSLSSPTVALKAPGELVGVAGGNWWGRGGPICPAPVSSP